MVYREIEANGTVLNNKDENKREPVTQDAHLTFSLPIELLVFPFFFSFYRLALLSWIDVKCIPATNILTTTSKYNNYI